MFCFTIRDLLWLMVVVGLGMGWWLDSRNQRSLLRHAVAKAALFQETMELQRELKNRNPSIGSILQKHGITP